MHNLEGEIKMTVEQLELIKTLRELNYSYNFIACELSLSVNTVKSFCRRKGIKAYGKRKTKAEKAAAPICKYCHKLLPDQLRSDAKFCSNICRTKWYRQNLKITKK